MEFTFFKVRIVLRLHLSGQLFIWSLMKQTDVSSTTFYRTWGPFRKLLLLTNTNYYTVPKAKQYDNSLILISERWKNPKY